MSKKPLLRMAFLKPLLLPGFSIYYEIFTTYHIGNLYDFKLFFSKKMAAKFQKPPLMDWDFQTRPKFGPLGGPSQPTSHHFLGIIFPKFSGVNPETRLIHFNTVAPTPPLIHFNTVAPIPPLCGDMIWIQATYSNLAIGKLIFLNYDAYLSFISIS